MARVILSTKLRNQFSSDYTVSLKNIIINGDKRGCSGFIALGGRIVYVNTEQCFNLGFMYRTAKHMRDYTGGSNRFAKDLDALVSGINSLLA